MEIMTLTVENAENLAAKIMSDLQFHNARTQPFTHLIFHTSGQDVKYHPFTSDRYSFLNISIPESGNFGLVPRLYRVENGAALESDFLNFHLEKIGQMEKYKEFFDLTDAEYEAQYLPDVLIADKSSF